jgi:hypothetical protein
MSRGGSNHQTCSAPMPTHGQGCCTPRPPRRPRCCHRPRRQPPTGCGRARGLDLTARGALRQGYAQALLGLLDLRGGGPCRAVGGVMLLRGCGGLAQHKDLVRGNNDRSGGEGPTPPTTPSATSVTEAAGAAAIVSTSWGRDAPVPSLADDGGDTTTADSVPAADSSRTSTATSDAVGGTEPPAPSYWRSADMTDVMVSKIDGSANIRCVATSSISQSLLGSSGHQGQWSRCWGSPSTDTTPSSPHPRPTLHPKPVKAHHDVETL